LTHNSRFHILRLKKSNVLSSILILSYPLIGLVSLAADKSVPGGFAVWNTVLPSSSTRVGRLIKQQGLESKSKHKFKAATNSNLGRSAASNILDHEFIVEWPDSVYAGDITYI
jgi:hypothetical protein